MRPAARLLLGLLLLVGGVRAVAFLAYAALMGGWPQEVYHLEAKMVHLAWRVQHGVRLYPDWRTGPYMANFFGPVYFALVGGIGRLAGADLAGLFVIGRAVTLGADLLGAVGLGIYLGRRHGRGAGLAGAVLALGVAPQYGYGLMARPDALADLLGLAGFALAVSGGRGRRFAGAAVLDVAILTKQTAGGYLLAAALAWAARGEGRRAARLAGGAAGTLAAAVAVITWAVEPNFGPGLLAEGCTPWTPGAWFQVLRNLARTGPDLPAFAAIGLAAWNTGGRRERAPTVLTVVLLAVGLTTAAKRGADLNYFLGLRNVEALAAGALWHVAVAPETRRRGPWLAATALGVAATAQSAQFMAGVAEAHGRLRASFDTAMGRGTLAAQERLVRLARDPAARLLTDSGLLDIQRGARADFADPWLFRMLAETGRLDLRVLVGRVARGEYGLIVTRHDLFAPSYATYEFGLPMPVAEAARARYEPAGRQAGFYVYVPRRRGSPTAGPPDRRD